jgi:hypothetical protein
LSMHRPAFLTYSFINSFIHLFFIQSSLDDTVEAPDARSMEVNNLANDTI